MKLRDSFENILIYKFMMKRKDKTQPGQILKIPKA